MIKVKTWPVIDGNLGWFDLCPDKKEYFGQKVTRNVCYDFTIVGAGFTGVALAYRLAALYPSARIALIDALRIGQGSSGRNAGFIVDIPHTLAPHLSDPAFAQSLYQLNTFAIDWIDAIRIKGGIDCQWARVGKYMAAHESKNERGINASVAMLDSLGIEYERLDAFALKQRLGTDYYQQAIYTPNNILMNPAVLIRGMVQGLPKTVTLYEDSPLQGYKLGQPHTLQFMGGELTTKTVIFTANAHNAALRLLTDRLVPCFTYASLTAPLTALQRKQYFNQVLPWGLTSAHPAGTTVRLTPDYRIFIRNKFDYAPKIRSTDSLLAAAKVKHQQAFNARFPFLPTPEFEYTWGGEVCVTLNAEPAFANVEENAYLIMGCNGVGITRGTYLGYYMADYINNIQSENLRFILAHSTPSWVPPEPFRGIGARARLYYEHYLAGGDV